MATEAPIEETGVLGAVRGLAGRVGGRADEIARGRALPPDLVEELRATGIPALYLPKELGGEEADPVEVFRAVEALSTADGSLGWCAAVAVGTAPLAAYLPEEGARQVFSRPDAFAGGSLNPKEARGRPVHGGLRVSGRWGFGSGVRHSEWMCGACLVVDDEGRPQLTDAGSPIVRLAFFPRADVTVHDTWHVSGLEGTGSHDFSVDDVLVPAERTMGFDFLPWPGGDLWRVPPLSLVFGPFAAVPLGIARAAVDELVGLAVAKTPYRSARRLADRDVVQAMVARAEAAVRSARAFLVGAMRELTDAARHGDGATLHQRAILRLAIVNASRAAVDAVELCYEVAGTTSIFTAHRLNRHWRDAHAASQHVVLAYSGWETVGRVLLGLEPDTALV
ncbi:MAG TPA: acyl-CoA dehydrogenase family protein [Acidimicrobiales bacterium]|nr:acyl-CoA dehydrogenase family protein [Acidimicrobiales bacterium]